MSSSPATQSGQECTFCLGTGWTLVQVPGSAAMRATRCRCHTDARTARMIAAARIPERYEHCSLLTFEAGSHFDKSLHDAKIDAVTFAENYPANEKEGLLFIGPLGVGKTHLAIGILKELIRNKSVPCLFIDYRELLKEIQNSYNANVQATELQILRPVFDADVLLIDELGAIRVTEWVWDTVSHILNYRYNNKKSTLITTNLPNLPERRETKSRHHLSKTEEVEWFKNTTLGDRITDRMRSRLHEMCRIIEITGTDYRMQIKSHNVG
jgi:DNA replication protein DnaC